MTVSVLLGSVLRVAGIVDHTGRKKNNPLRLPTAFPFGFEGIADQRNVAKELCSNPGVLIPNDSTQRQNLAVGDQGFEHALFLSRSAWTWSPGKFRVIVTRRPKYGCRSCTDGVVQALPPARLIEAGLRGPVGRDRPSPRTR